ncbi:MAG: hypothetical protein J3K34DRAFT_524025 [Monoraphidium minutum]|nr:MAG: hypothetical protein J3K34DRAFT_524025 [Monoraphidium minutum]
MDELVLIEGDEEVQYILVDLPDGAPAEIDAPGAVLTLQGLDTDEPALVDGDGNVLLRGRHQDTLGSVLVMALGPSERGGGGGGADGQAAAQGGAEQQPPPGAGAGEGAAAAAAAAAQDQQQPQRRRQQQARGARYLCHLEKRLVFSLPDAAAAAEAGS